MKEFEFALEIKEGPGGGAWVEIPLDIRKEFGTGGQVRVFAAFDGEPYRGSLAPMGGGKHVLGIQKAIRKKIGKDIGEVVQLTFRQDLEPRTVEVPPELKAALAGSVQAKAAYEKLSDTHRREYARWVAEAKKAETRVRRAEKAVEKLLER